MVARLGNGIRRRCDDGRVMDDRQQLAALLEENYRGLGWSVDQCADGTVRAKGHGGVTWIGLPVTAATLDDPSFPDTLLALASERMPTGELCPLELLPDPVCEPALRDVLERVRLADRGHVEVYAVAA